MPDLFDREPVAGYARVAVERGVDRYPDGLTYAIPRALADVRPGDRVVVPLGRGDRDATGYVIEITPEPALDPDRLKPIRAREGAGGARLPGELLELARWMSGYYCAPIGMTLATMLPAAVKRGVGTVLRTMLDLGTPPDGQLPPKQRALVETLAALDPSRRPVEQRALLARAGVKTAAPVRRLLERGVLVAERRSVVEAVWSEHAVDARAPAAPTPAQAAVLSELGGAAPDAFAAHLLFGVTGSGKTEVYVRLVQRVVAAGRAALVLVPEIALTPQTGGRLVGRFPGHRVAILHSGLTAAQRHQQWALVAEGGAPIVLGARSAVFAPIPDGRLGLVIVDEEHDGSYKQDQAPRYHGRDVAVRRAQIARCPVVLGSATPSLESWANATVRGHYRLHRLPDRVPGARLPRVQVVDFAQQRRLRRDRRVHLLGPALETAVGEALRAGGQVLLLLNRRGYASYIACPDQRCGWVMQCDDCDVTMVYHVHRALPAGGFVRCHHCQTEQRLPATCPDCGRRVVTFGLGTQRVEEELHRKFPELVEGETMLRVDSDTMHGARDFHAALARFGAGELRLLVGTQMIAKGLDFPGVRLVGVVNADTAINLPDFRATERTFQLVSQVAGRSGRGTAAGTVVVQTFSPEAPAIRLAAAHDYESFARLELDERRRCGLPPFARLARVVVRHAEHARCVALARATAESLRALAGPDVRVRGPAPCPIARIAGRHRHQVELLAPAARELQALLAAARNRGVLRSDAAMAVDVDPVALL